MAQTTQIVPKYSFPYVETVINDYTLVQDTAVASTVDSSIKQVYAVTASKGIDNVWVRKSSRESAVKTFGESNFKKFGQPLMQALQVADQENSQVWMMRVMPENAAYSNGIVSAYYKADTAEDVADAHNRKFRIKLTSKSVENATTGAELAAKALEADGVTTVVDGVSTYKDAEGFTQAQLMTVNYSGRGVCGDYFSMRMSQALSYEKEYGIKMYNFEVINSENGIAKDANYVGALVSSAKYGSESTTLIDDVLDDAEVGLAPIDVKVNEDSVEEVYEAYVAFIKELHNDCVVEYEAKLDQYAIPEEMLNGSIPVTEDFEAQYNELKTIGNIIDQTEDDMIPDIDQFDIIFGLKVASSDKLPAIAFPTLLTDDVDTTAADYDAAMYTATTNLVDFSSAKGLVLANGGDGYFANPRTELVNGVMVTKTYADEVKECFIKAYNGTLDKRILSPRRMAITAFFDAGYPYEVKRQIAELGLARNDCRVYLDAGIVNSLSGNVVKGLKNDFEIFDDHAISVDITNYLVKEASTNKKVNVTINYFLAPQYVNHLTNYGYHIPFVKEYAQLAGHIRDSLCPVVEEYEVDLKEELYNSRLNYFECMSENVFQRAVQNTSQKDNTDLLEENNSTILYNIKRNVEEDVQGEIYNFADEGVRQSFIEIEKAKYASLVGNVVESFDITFATTQYEFEHSILHCYLSVVFRGLTKKAIVEIDINKRTYATISTGTTE